MSQPKRDTTKRSPMRLVLVLLLSTFAIEFGITALFLVLPPIVQNGWVEAAIDSSVLSAPLFPVLFFVVFRPLTRQVKELEQAEKEREQFQGRLQLALESGRLAVWDADVVGGKVWLSEQWAELLGESQRETWTSVEDLVAIAHPEDRQRLLNAVVAVMKGERPEYAEEHRVRTVTGEWRWLLSRGRVTERAADGHAARMSGTNLDITERKQAETERQRLAERLTLTNRALEQANRMKTDFMANVTHELRTPLNSVIGFAELLKDEVPGPLNAQQAQFAADILASGQRLLTLVEGILEMSRLDAAGAALERQSVEIGAALEERVAAHRKAAEAGRVSIALEVAANAGRADLDPKALRRTIDALLDNAIKFNREGGTVAVSARRAEGAIEIAVTDTGIGIAREDIAKLVKPLAQLDAGLARRHGGVGLGLALARRLAELHDRSGKRTRQRQQVYAAFPHT